MSYSRYGERGRIDLVGWHPAAGMLLIIECKTVLGDAQATLGTIDAKTRLARFVARQLDLPPPSAVVPVLIFRESMTSRRHVATLEPSVPSVRPARPAGNHLASPTGGPMPIRAADLLRRESRAAFEGEAAAAFGFHARS